jgi:transcriptional regulator with XRE-family HTH domain
MSGRIKEARLARNWSQQELADRVRVSQPTIVHWEQGTHTPRHLALARLSDALGVSRQWLLGEETHAAPAVALDAAIVPTPEATGVQAYLERAIVHVPVFDWPRTLSDYKAMLARYVAPRDYVVAPGGAPRTALACADPSVAVMLPAGSLLLVETDAGALEDGRIYLFDLDGLIAARRWRSAPDRLEADTLEQTRFVTSPPRPLGRIATLIRNL